MDNHAEGSHATFPPGPYNLDATKGIARPRRSEGPARLNPIHLIGSSLKKQKTCTKVKHLVLKPPYKSHKLMGILWAHMGCRVYSVLISVDCNCKATFSSLHEKQWSWWYSAVAGKPSSLQVNDLQEEEYRPDRAESLHIHIEGFHADRGKESGCRQLLQCD